MGESINEIYQVILYFGYRKVSDKKQTPLSKKQKTQYWKGLLYH